MNKKSFFVGGIVIVLAIIALIIFIGPNTPTQRTERTGGVNFEKEYFSEGFETAKPGYFGGVKTTLTSGTNATMTGDDFCNSSLMSFTSTGTGNVTFPTSAIINGKCLIRDAMSHSFIYRNVNATSASTTTMVAGTGMVLLEPENGDVIIEGGNYALINCVRDTSAIVICSVDERIDGD